MGSELSREELGWEYTKEDQKSSNLGFADAYRADLCPS